MNLELWHQHAVEFENDTEFLTLPELNCTFKL